MVRPTHWHTVDGGMGKFLCKDPSCKVGHMEKVTHRENNAIEKIQKFKRKCEESREKWRLATDSSHIFVNEGMIQAYNHCLEILASAATTEPNEGKNG